VYLFGTMVQEALTVATADGSHPRIDIVVARVYDLGTSGSSCDVDIVTGTPATSPVAPATPAASLLLAQVLVPASGVLDHQRRHHRRAGRGPHLPAASSR